MSFSIDNISKASVNFVGTMLMLIYFFLYISIVKIIFYRNNRRLVIDVGKKKLINTFSHYKMHMMCDICIFSIN